MKRGRIEAVYPGQDGLIRMVDERTGRSVKRRPITGLSPFGSWRALNEHPCDASHSYFLIDFEQFLETIELCSFILVSSFIELALDFFNYHTHDDFDIADPSSTQDACHTWTFFCPSSSRVLRSSVVRASDRWTEGPKFSSYRELSFFFVLCSWHVTSLHYIISH